MRVATTVLFSCVAALSIFWVTALEAHLQGKAEGERSSDKRAIQKEVAPLPRPLTVFLLRHAETIDDSRDPDLSKVGLERSKALERLLAKSRVTHLFTSEYRRTGATLGPLAKALGLSRTKIPARSPEKQIAALRALPSGSIAVVAGHSNTIPKLCKMLAGSSFASLPDPKIAHDSHDRLFMVSLQAGAVQDKWIPQCIELRYGAGKN